MGYPDGSRMLIAWPEGTSSQVGQEDRIVIRDVEGDLIATEGEKVSLGGGYFPTEDWERIPIPLQHEPPSRCETEEVFLASVDISFE
jgi:hypothetical protein